MCSCLSAAQRRPFSSPSASHEQSSLQSCPPSRAVLPPGRGPAPRLRTALRRVEDLFPQVFRWHLPAPFSPVLLCSCSESPCLFWVVNMHYLSFLLVSCLCTGIFVLFIFVYSTGPRMILFTFYCSIKCWINTCDIMKMQRSWKFTWENKA